MTHVPILKRRKGGADHPRLRARGDRDAANDRAEPVHRGAIRAHLDAIRAFGVLFGPEEFRTDARSQRSSPMRQRCPVERVRWGLQPPGKKS